jgi:hypothetical protein
MLVRKPRTLYIAWTPPSTDSGAGLAMRRHLVERKYFETFMLLYRDALNLRLQPVCPRPNSQIRLETEHSTATKVCIPV